jgi:hypothetical protein
MCTKRASHKSSMKTITVEALTPDLGLNYDSWQTAEHCAEQANTSHQQVLFVFNGILAIANPGMSREDVLRSWRAGSEALAKPPKATDKDASPSAKGVEKQSKKPVGAKKPSTITAAASAKPATSTATSRKQVAIRACGWCEDPRQPGIYPHPTRPKILICRNCSLRFRREQQPKIKKEKKS